MGMRHNNNELAWTAIPNLQSLPPQSWEEALDNSLLQILLELTERQERESREHEQCLTDNVSRVVSLVLGYLKELQGAGGAYYWPVRGGWA